MTDSHGYDENYVRRALEVSVHVGLLAMLAAACLFILRPFIPLIAWGIIIAIASYPAYRRVRSWIGGSSRLAAVICTLFMLTLLIVPLVLLTGSLVDGVHSLTARLREGTQIIPAPPPRIENWPLIGAPLKHAWDLASTNLSAALQTFAPQIKALIPQLLSASAGIGMAALQWMLSIVLAGVLLANAASGAKIAHSLANRLLGEKGPEFEQLAGSTIRSITTGIVGVAFIQALFASVGFLVAGLPGAGLWAVIFLIAAVVQLGVVVLIPAVIYMFAIASTTKAVIFLGWCVIVGVMDNILKPLLLGRGVAVPMAVVFLGAIGGFIAIGPIGLFVGAIALAVGYKLLLAWMETTAKIAPEIVERSSPPVHVARSAS
jgi:predicted PurR-regulated permease PerM